MKLLLVLLLLASVSASAQTVSPGPRGPQNIFSYQSGTGTGNGADLTEDTLQSFTLPAGQLLNVGDRIHVTAGGTLGATTDTKVIRLKLGSSGSVCGIQSTTAGQTAWAMICDIIKTSSNNQLISGLTMNTNAAAGTNVTLNQTDTGTLALVITGQNSTNSVLNSLVLRNMIVDYIPAGP